MSLKGNARFFKFLPYSNYVFIYEFEGQNGRVKESQDQFTMMRLLYFGYIRRITKWFSRTASLPSPSSQAQD